MYHNLFLFLGVKRTLHGSVKPRSNSFGSPNSSSSVSYCLFISGLHSSGLNPLKEGDSWYLGDTLQGGGESDGWGKGGSAHVSCWRKIEPMQFPFDSKKKEKILIHLIFLKIKEVFYNFELKFSKFLFHYSGDSTNSK